MTDDGLGCFVMILAFVVGISVGVWANKSFDQSKACAAYIAPAATGADTLRIAKAHPECRDAYFPEKG